MAFRAEWEPYPCGAYISIPIRPRDLDDVWEWCIENCQGDFLIDLGRRVLFQLRDDAAVATLWWRAE
jgi:hypothetical protein